MPGIYHRRTTTKKHVSEYKQPKEYIPEDILANNPIMK
jgi:hypothetical protein